MVQLGTDTTTSAEDGAFSFVDVPAGRYLVSIRVPGYLSAQLTDLEVVGEAVDAGVLVLLAGDVNNTGEIGQRDLTLITVELGNTPAEDPLVDYNRDGRVDVRDLVLAASNLGKQEMLRVKPTSTDLSGVASNLDDGAPLSEVTVTLLVDVNGDGSFAPLGRPVFVPGSHQFFAETYRELTDLQGLFTVKGLPVQVDEVPLGVFIELRKDGFATYTQVLDLSHVGFLELPLAPAVEPATVEIGPEGQIMITGKDDQIEIEVPADALPPGTTSVTALIASRNPQDDPDLFPGNFRASDPTLGEVQLESTVYSFIELRDQDGNTILETNDSGAPPSHLRMQVPPGQYVTLRDVTPGISEEVNVPLYFFDYEAGLWRPSGVLGRLEAEDGSPIKQEQLSDIWSGEFEGPLFVAGEVTHFSAWNVDYPMTTHAAVCGRVVDSTGATVSGARISTFGTTFSSSWVKGQYTDGSGNFCDDGKVTDEEDDEDEAVGPPQVRIISSNMGAPTEFWVGAKTVFRGEET